MKNSGVTLVELLVVVSIIGVLIIAMGFSYEGWVGNYRLESMTKELYFDLYDSPCGEIVINLVDAEAQELTVRYEFCEGDFPVPPGPPLPPVYKLPEDENDL